MEEIAHYEIDEAVPKLESIIWNTEPILQAISLQILNLFNSSKTYEYTLAFIDSIDNNSYENSSISSLDLKMKVVHILFAHNNFSLVGNVFEIINRDKPEISPYAREILDDIIRKVPEFADSAKAELLKLAMGNNVDSRDRYFALAQLNELYSDEMLPEIRETFIQNSDTPTRILAMEFLVHHQYAELNTLLKDRLQLDPDPSLRYRISEELLKNFGSVSNYSFLQNYNINEIDTTISYLIKSELYLYKPKEPQTGKAITIIIDTLTSYTNQCYNYEWLKDEIYKNELLTKLTNAENYLNAGDSLNCKTEITAFQNSVDLVYQNPEQNYPKYVSDEGYKFLYYYVGYIIERL